MAAGTGVYFAREDYASFWRRVLVVVVDLFVFGALCLLLTIPATMFSELNSAKTILATWLTIGFSYFVLLKRSRFRTLGYRIGGVRIVAFDGEAPSYWMLTLRLIFGTVSPLFWLDLIWLANDSNCQALRDKFAGTYVVKMKAEPAGRGRILYPYYSILLYNFLFREVERGS